ncbi:Ff.00g010310.m01.CDS01 [Fusarium sp. VM40]|nr:Ff.00g010310.m01.CDS01 [Fusarium sp. VM40]
MDLALPVPRSKSQFQKPETPVERYIWCGERLAEEDPTRYWRLRLLQLDKFVIRKGLTEHCLSWIITHLGLTEENISTPRIARGVLHLSPIDTPRQRRRQTRWRPTPTRRRSR